MPDTVFGRWRMAPPGKQNSRHRDRRQVIGMYCTVEEVLGMIKDDMRNVIIGDEYIEDEQEREAKITTLCEDAISAGSTWSFAVPFSTFVVPSIWSASKMSRASSSNAGGTTKRSGTSFRLLPLSPLMLIMELLASM